MHSAPEAHAAQRGPAAAAADAGGRAGRVLPGERDQPDGDRQAPHAARPQLNCVLSQNCSLIQNGCAADINGDGGYNVLDIVTLANCVLSQNCSSVQNGCAGDMNGDGGYNVLDIVTLANCILSGTCE